ncbi:hypothetical protein DP171_26465 [Klebsiella pneumoniae]|nr:hypothetical protein [Klebsiella pneumoniae]
MAYLLFSPLIIITQTEKHHTIKAQSHATIIITQLQKDNITLLRFILKSMCDYVTIISTQ